MYGVLRKSCVALLISSLLITAGCAQEDKINALENEITNLQSELDVERINHLRTKKELEAEKESNKAEINKAESKEEKRTYDVNGFRIADARDGYLRFIRSESRDAMQSLFIVGNNIDELVEEYEEVDIKGLREGEILEVEVIGSIYDFQLVELAWDDETNDFYEVQIISELKEVRNTAVYIESYLPCGMPSEKIKWKDLDGEEYEVYLSNDGYGFAGTIIWAQ